MTTGTRRTVLFSVGAIAVMVALVVASVPLYSLFCRVTGYAGTPRIASGDSPVTSDRMVTVRFDASVMHGMPWRFTPDQTSLQVRLGETQLASFTAENTSDQPITGTAAFNVTPAKAGRYVDKIACFCFSAQRLAAGQKVEMPVSFYIDPKIADDPDTNDVSTITLSYTFFKARDQTPPTPPAENPS
ncbi:MAG TPA: cytochrome c oxidase assembly protein [Patescibacteria group bacterium]|nr:cytochrome c oxidase assembly protein [Patescibacteria group bacterium]